MIEYLDKCRKKVFITGANGGIGRALVEAFAKEGYEIFANIRAKTEDFICFTDDLSVKNEEKQYIH